MTTENLSGVLPFEIELDALLLDAKLSVPQPRPGSVSRAPLIETARSSDCRVVGVTAPAGYGKSTLLTEWAHSEDRPVAWVSLDQLDDDPAALITLLASAYVRASGVDADLVGNVGGAGTVGAGPRCAASRYGLLDEPISLCADDGRSALTSVAELPRRAERGDFRDSSGLAAGGNESIRAAPSSEIARDR